MLMRLRKKRGQSTLEYILLFAGLTLAILYGVSSVVTPKAKSQMDTAGEIVSKADTELRTAAGLVADTGD